MFHLARLLAIVDTPLWSSCPSNSCFLWQTRCSSPTGRHPCLRCSRTVLTVHSSGILPTSPRGRSVTSSVPAEAALTSAYRWTAQCLQSRPHYSTPHYWSGTLSRSSEVQGQACRLTTAVLSPRKFRSQDCLGSSWCTISKCRCFLCEEFWRQIPSWCHPWPRLRFWMSCHQPRWLTILFE